MVLGIDSPIGLSVMRELAGHGVPVHGVGKPHGLGRASRACASFSARPAAPIADWLPALIAATGARALFAVSENDLIALARLPETIEGCHILTARAGPLHLVLDKRETLARAAAIGLDTPRSWSPAAGEDFAAYAAAFRYPVVAKWPDPMLTTPLLEARGIAFVKAEIVQDAAALLAVLRRYDPLGQWPLVQSYCPGVGVGQMIHMDGDAATLVFQHRRLHEWPPEGGVSTWCRAEPADLHRDQMARSIELLRAIGWQGAAMVEYRYDPKTGRYWLMEINGRFWGSLPLARHCGAHFAWESYRRTVLGDRSPAPPSRSDLRARYMIPETRRLARLLFARKAITDPVFVATPLRDLAAYLAGFLDPRTRYYVWSLRDPGPVLADVRNIMQKAWPRGKRARD